MKKLAIFELDGVIYRGDEPMPRAAEAVAELRARGIAVRFLTNNSTRSRAFYCEKIARMGIPCAKEEMMSSGFATRIYLEERAPHARVYIVGESGIAEELEGFTIVGPEERETADFVVVGLDRGITYEKLTHAMDALMAGAELIATNRDATYPMPNGYLLPGGGALVAALAEIWGREPYVAGKPNPLGILYMMKAAGVKPEDVLLIGDRPAADMVTGRRAGARTCLVLTGVTPRDEVPALTGELKPDCVVDDLGGLLDLDCLKPDAAKASYNEAKIAF